MGYFKTKNLKLETPETGNSPLVTGDLKKLAEQLDLLLEPGDLKLSAVSTPPTGWLACEGQAVSRSTYSGLFTAIGTTYGEGDKSTTFNVPNFTERVPVGVGSASGYKRGEKGGVSTVTLTTSQLPAHKHAVTDPGHNHGVTDPGHIHSTGTWIYSRPGEHTGGQILMQDNTVEYASTALATLREYTNLAVNTTTTGISTNNEGGSTSHTNVQPYETCNVFIKT